MLRIAFAGFRHSHILALYTAVLKSTCAKIVGAYEADAATREKIERENGICCTYNSYEVLLADTSVDAVAIGDYYGARGAEVIAALENGKHVIAAISSATPTSNPLGAGNEQRQTLRGGNRVE